MNGFKQRVIGAIVLISLAVIFVPMLFDEPHTERTSRAIDLPEEPAFPKVNIEQPDTATQNTSESPPGYTLEEQAGDSGAAGNRASENGDSFPAADMSSGNAGGGDTTTRDMPAASTTEPVQPVTEQSLSPSSTQNPTTSDAGAGTAAGSNASEADDKVMAEEFDQSLKGAWMVQLGSFGNDSNAKRLRDNVRKAGYAAHTQTVKRGDKNLTRVFSGPYAAKSDATDAKKALDKEFSVNSLVMVGDK